MDNLCQRKINSTLGPRPITTSAGKRSGSSRDQANDFLKIIERRELERKRKKSRTIKLKETGSTLSQLKVARVMGYCGISAAKDMPSLWRKTQATTCYRDHRVELSSAMKT